MAPPKVSVVMTAFNSSAYLSEAVESILGQTFSDFEFIIIDDGSTDGTWEMLTSYAASDGRIVLARNEENLGTGRSSNKGLDLARGKYVARFDSDDVALPHRLEEQVKYMDSNPAVGLITTSVEYIDTQGQTLGYYTPPEEPILLAWKHIFSSPLRHPTAFWRRELLESKIGQYNLEFRYSLDYEFFVRAAAAVTVETLPRVLLKMRQNPKSVTFSKGSMQDDFAARVTYRQIDQVLRGKSLTDAEKFELRALLRRYSPIQDRQFESLDRLCLERALKNYLALVKAFYTARKDEANSKEISAFLKEVEASLPNLMNHCFKQGWNKLGWHFLRSYLAVYPSRLPHVLTKLTLYFGYYRLREISFLKNSLQNFRAAYGRKSSQKTLAQGKSTVSIGK
jgi:glycosyltransferase involved in cell wall biosynthesis